MTIAEQRKNTGFYSISGCLLVLGMVLLAGCASRDTEPVTHTDSTITYSGKDTNDVAASIILYRFEEENNNRKIGMGTKFYIGEDDYVRAQVDLNNLFSKTLRPQMFHLEWINPEEHSFYMKREELKPEDSVAFLYSSISVDPDREPGKYALKVYHFRELIAEKHFELIPDSLEQPGMVEGISGNIVLCSKVNHKTGKRIGIDTIFTMGKHDYVRAFVDLKNRFINDDLNLKFDLEWTGPDDQPVYTKDIELKPDNPDTTIYSSISIPPGKREPGNYLFRVRLFGRLLAEQHFLLK